MSRMLAAKASLATRVDALGEDGSFDLGAEHKAKLEARLRILEEGNLRKLSGTGKAKAKFEKYHGKSEYMQYPAAADTTISSGKRRYSEIDEKKPLIKEIEEKPIEEVPKKKKKKQSLGSTEESTLKETEVTVKLEGEPTPKKKKKKIKQESAEDEDTASGSVKVEKTPVKAELSETFEESSETGEEQKKKKKKKKKGKDEQEALDTSIPPVEDETSEQVSSEKKKKKKKKSQDE